MQMQPVQPDQPLSVTLAAQEWNVVMAALDELPGRIGRPVFNKLGGQLEAQSRPRLTTEDVARVVPDGP